MDKKSKIFFIIFGLLIAGSVAVTYWKIMIKRDYVITAQAECDPYTENCFVHMCDPDPDVDAECTGDIIEDTWYTKNISRMAYNIPDCDPNDEACTALICPEEGEESCSYELCDETNVPEGDSCNDPEQYTLDNPVEEEVECDPEADEVCEVTDEEVSDETAACDSETDDVCPIDEIGATDNPIAE